MISADRFKTRATESVQRVALAELAERYARLPADIEAARNTSRKDGH
jgi:hypothetical protein